MPMRSTSSSMIMAVCSLYSREPVARGALMNGSSRSLKETVPFMRAPLATGSREYSEQTAMIIDEEVHRIVMWAYDRAISLLSEHRETLDCIARSLRLHETLDARQLRAIMENTHAVHTGPL